TWQLDAHGGVTGSITLSLWCGPGCAESWTPVAALDLNGDGRKDLLWQATTGDFSGWYLGANGDVIGGAGLAWLCDANCSHNYRIVAAVDVNGDGHADLVWRNVNTGEMVAWTLGANGAVFNVVPMAPCTQICPLGWSVVGAGDFNHDGMDDLLW